jgi:pyruvate dehydrogenase E2 component (dihydrolipoamide acetyltransferase)
MRVPIVVPEVGVDPATELRVSTWFASAGQRVLEGDRVVEMLAGNATFDVPAPGNGRILRIIAREDETIGPRGVLGILDLDAADS